MLRLLHLMAFALFPLALAPIGASGAGADKVPAPTLATSGPLSCDIRVTEVPGGISLQPIAIAKTAISGSYEFAVSKTSLNGTAMTSQGGGFSASPGQTVVLSESAMDASGSLVATLRLTWSGGTLSCEKRYPKV